MRLATIKLVGYVEVIHALLPRFGADASVVLFGGQARERPYPGSTTVTAINGAVTTMVRNLAYELPALRFNAIHPGVVVDTPAWAGNTAVLDRTRSQTPGGRLVDHRRLRRRDPVPARQRQHERREPGHQFRLGAGVAGAARCVADRSRRTGARARRLWITPPNAVMAGLDPAIQVVSSND